MRPTQILVPTFALLLGGCKCSSEPEPISQCKNCRDAGGILFECIGGINGARHKGFVCADPNSIDDRSPGFMCNQRVIFWKSKLWWKAACTEEGDTYSPVDGSTSDEEVFPPPSVSPTSDNGEDDGGPDFEAVCGNGITEEGEQCDDGNALDGDLCTNFCRKALCGDGVTSNLNGEECDDKNAVDSDECTNNCKVAFCGDSIVHTPHEECDDGNAIEDDACNSACKLNDALPICGDGVIQGDEECDDANSNSEDACSNTCLRARIVFVTSSEYAQGFEFAGVETADELCKESAAIAGLPGAFRAWLSDDFTSPSEWGTSDFTGAFRLVDGTLVAINWEDLLDGELENPINVDEFGLHLAAKTCFVWTGTLPDGGSSFANCGNWTGQDEMADLGNCFTATHEWTLADVMSCAAPRHLYCFERF